MNETNIDANARDCKRVSPLNISSDPGFDISGLPKFSCASSSATNYRVRSFHATPTASSEASWNSQTGLFSNPPGAIAVPMKMKNPTNNGDAHNKRNKGSTSTVGKTKWLIWRQRCPCPCSDKKSIQVEPKTPLSITITNSNHKLKAAEDQKNSNPSVDDKQEVIPAQNHQFHSSLRPLKINDGSGAIAGFTFPVLQLKMAVNGNEDPPLEVFRPKSDDQLLVLSRSTTTDQDDVGSDTSSDLFEIESFSTTITTTTTTMTSYPNTIMNQQQQQQRRDSLDEASSFNTRRSSILAAGELAAINNAGSYNSAMMMMRDCCYEPSEASIEWSVTTDQEMMAVERRKQGIC